MTLFIVLYLPPGFEEWLAQAKTYSTMDDADLAAKKMVARGTAREAKPAEVVL